MRWALAMLSVLGAGALAVGLTGASHHHRDAPPLPGRALRGAPVTLADLRGRPAIIDFFASWCGPCAKEAPALQEAAQRLSGRASVIAVDWSDGQRSALGFIRRYHWTIPVLADPGGTAGYAYGVHGLPAAFVIDAAGHLRSALIGPQTAETLVHAVRLPG